MKIFLTSLVISFIGLLLLTTGYNLIDESPNSFWHDFSNSIILSLGGAFIFSITVYLINVNSHAKKKRLFKQGLFREMMDAGFVQKEDFIYGIINDYTVMMSFSIEEGSPAILLQVLFNPVKNNSLLSDEEIQRLQKSVEGGLFHRKLFFSQNGVTYVYPNLFKSASRTKVVTICNHITALLQRNNLDPISLDQSEEVLKFIRHDKENRFSGKRGCINGLD